jgi:hypothetical protein
MKPASVIFISKEGLATFWFFLAACAVIGSGYYVLSQTVKAGLRPQFIIMANRDVLPMDPGMDPDKMADIHRSQTRLAMDSIFNKGPSGLDAKERCRRLLAGEAWDWVQGQLLDKQADAFREGHMHQKVEIGSIELRPLAGQNDKATLASVKGQLIRTGVLDDKLFNEVWEVRAELVWMPNPSLRTSGTQPTVCTQFNCRETPVATTLQRTGPKAAEPAAAPQSSPAAPDGATN